MIIMIEYSFGDRYLFGRRVSFDELKEQLYTIEKKYDRKTDDFVTLLCMTYSWQEIVWSCVKGFDYIYDRDTGLLLRKVPDT